MKGNKYSYLYADLHILEKYNNRHINCGNDEKNQRFNNNQFGSYNSYWNNLLQYKVTYKCFIDFVCRVNYYMFDNHY